MVERGLRELWRMATDLLYPPFCAHCRLYISERVPFCGNCCALIMPTASKTLRLTADVTMPVFAVGDYREPLKALISAKEYGNRLASKQLAWCMAQMSYSQELRGACLVPVPLHWTRYARRGFNQTAVIAESLAPLVGAHVAHLVQRSRKTAYQADFKTLADCTRNVSEAFALTVADPVRYHDAHLVIVDDLMTTGTTLIAVARELLALKPKRISAVVTCRVHS